MPFDATRHHRRSIRLPWYDYTRAGAYFVTICTDARRFVFGEIRDGQMHLNDLGRIVQACWEDLPNHTHEIELDAFQIMPNHVHGVFWIVGATPASPAPSADVPQPPVGATPASPSCVAGQTIRPRGPGAGSVGAIVGGFKSAVSRNINRVRGKAPRPLWQRDYFEHVIRDDEALDAIREYVRTNPQRWEDDKENPFGRGTDDVEVWVNSLASRPRDGVSDEEDEGDAGVAPTSPHRSRGATQASPLQETRTAPGEQARATESSSVPLRIGHGFDLHRLAPGPRLVLAGVTVSEDIRPVAHSDGDVVLHALVDALLGAMGWGDIGEHFPDSDLRWKNAPSRVFVHDVSAKIRTAGYTVGNVDITILAERPKLMPFKDAMIGSLAEILGVSKDRVNIKAGTNEGCDAVGRGEAIAAHAVVLLAAERGNA